MRSAGHIENSVTGSLSLQRRHPSRATGRGWRGDQAERINSNSRGGRPSYYLLWRTVKEQNSTTGHKRCILATHAHVGTAPKQRLVR